MKRTLIACLIASATLLGAGAAVAADGLVLARNAAQKWATLPEGVHFPEGIAANPATGEVFVGTFDFGAPNKLLRLAPNGKVVAQKDFGGEPLLGLAYEATSNKVLIANVGTLAGQGPSRIQRIAADFLGGTTVEEVAAIPVIGPPGNRSVGNPDGSLDTITFGAGAAAPNAMVFDSTGNLYVSDSFQGAIFRIAGAATCANPCTVETVVHHPLLATAGFPPFGANGVALSEDGATLFVANTGDDRILKVDLATQAVTVFAESVNGADGIAFDHRGRLWVAANQADEVVALNDRGRVIARLGEFQGINRDGTPNGLLFPASIAIVGDHMFVTNLALALNGTAGDEPEEGVTRYTVSRIKIPNR